MKTKLFLFLGLFLLVVQGGLFAECLQNQEQECRCQASFLEAARFCNERDYALGGLESYLIKEDQILGFCLGGTYYVLRPQGGEQVDVALASNQLTYSLIATASWSAVQKSSFTGAVSLGEEMASIFETAGEIIAVAVVAGGAHEELPLAEARRVESDLQLSEPSAPPFEGTLAARSTSSEHSRSSGETTHDSTPEQKSGEKGSPASSERTLSDTELHLSRTSLASHFGKEPFHKGELRTPTFGFTKGSYDYFWKMHEQRQSFMDQIKTLEAKLPAAQKAIEAKYAEFQKASSSLFSFSKGRLQDELHATRRAQAKLQDQISDTKNRLIQTQSSIDGLFGVPQAQLEKVLPNPLPELLVANGSVSKEQLEAGYRYQFERLRHDPDTHNDRTKTSPFAVHLRQESLLAKALFHHEGVWLTHDEFNRPLLSTDALALEQKAGQDHLELLDSIALSATEYVTPFDQMLAPLKNEGLKDPERIRKTFDIEEGYAPEIASLPYTQKAAKIQEELTHAKRYFSNISQIRKNLTRKNHIFQNENFWKKDIFDHTRNFVGVSKEYDPKDLLHRTNRMIQKCIEGAKLVERLEHLLLPEKELSAEIERLGGQSNEERLAEIYQRAGVTGPTVTEEAIAAYLEEEAVKAAAAKIAQEEAAKVAAAKKPTPSPSSTSVYPPARNPYDPTTPNYYRDMQNSYNYVRTLEANRAMQYQMGQRAANNALSLFKHK